MAVAGPIAKSYSYDASGNALSDGNSSFIWNANGRLSKVITGAQIDIYQHNALGERISKRSSALGNDPWRFIYDSAGHLLGEYDVNNNPLQETVWLGDLPVAVIKQDTVTNQPIVYYVHADHLNTPRVILNTNNTAVWRWDSDAFGVGAANQDPDGDGVAFVYNPRFPGQYYDAESGLYYNYQRTYDPATGRYLQSDPIGLAGGLNTYGYVGGNPVSFVDSNGLATTGSNVGGVIGSVIGTRLGMPAVGRAIGSVVGSAVEDAIEKCNDDNECKSNTPITTARHNAYMWAGLNDQNSNGISWTEYHSPKSGSETTQMIQNELTNGNPYGHEEKGNGLARVYYHPFPDGDKKCPHFHAINSKGVEVIFEHKK